MKRLKQSYVTIGFRVCLTIFSVICLDQGALFGQQDTPEKILNNAQEEYDVGHYQNVLKILRPTILDFNREQKTRAYVLMILCFKHDNQLDSAFHYTVALVDLKHDFREENDTVFHVEFYQLYDSVRSHPTLQVSLHAGVNWTDVLTSPRQYGVDQTDTDRDYTAELGFHPIGIEVERPLIQHTTDWQTYLKRKRQYFSLGVGLRLTQRRFSISHQYATENFPYPVAEFNLFSGIERDQWAALSPYVRYQQYNRDKTLGFYGKAGTGFHYLLRSHLVQVDRNTQVSPQPNVASTALQLTQDKIDLLAEEFHLRQRFNFSLQLGGGIFWRLLSSPHYLMIGADYQFFRRHLDLSNQRYQNPRLLYDFGYVDDALFIHSFHLKAGVQFQLFSPQKM